MQIYQAFCIQKRIFSYPQASVAEIHFFFFLQIRLIGVSLPTQNKVPKLAGKGKHALIGAGGLLSLSALNNHFSILHSDAANKVQLETSPQYHKYLAFPPTLNQKKIIFPKHAHLLSPWVPF